MEWLKEHQYLATWLAGLATLLAVIVALFIDKIKRVLYRPRISIIPHNRPPWIYPGKSGKLANVTCSLKIENHGNMTAKNCLAMVERLITIEPNQVNLKNEHHFYKPLYWREGKDTPVDIYPGSYSFLNLLMVIYEPVQEGMPPSNWKLFVSPEPTIDIYQDVPVRGRYEIYFQLNSDTMDSIKYRAVVYLEKEKVEKDIIPIIDVVKL